MCNTFGLSTEKKNVTRTERGSIFTLHLHCLSCLKLYNTYCYKQIQAKESWHINIQEEQINY